MLSEAGPVSQRFPRWIPGGTPKPKAMLRQDSAIFSVDNLRVCCRQLLGRSEPKLGGEWNINSKQVYWGGLQL